MKKLSSYIKENFKISKNTKVFYVHSKSEIDRILNFVDNAPVLIVLEVDHKKTGKWHYIPTISMINNYDSNIVQKRFSDIINSEVNIHEKREKLAKYLIGSVIVDNGGITNKIGEQMCDRLNTSGVTYTNWRDPNVIEEEHMVELYAGKNKQYKLIVSY